MSILNPDAVKKEGSMSLNTLPFTVAPPETIDPVDKPIIDVVPLTPGKVSAALAGAIQKVLEEKVSTHPEFDNILLATADGFDVAAIIKDSDKESIRRLAAISSSMLSLSIELLAEMSAGELKILTLEGDRGNIFITQVSADAFTLSLTIITRESASLGKFFWLIRQLKQEIEAVCTQPVSEVTDES